jgi:hypothetical protein
MAKKAKGDTSDPAVGNTGVAGPLGDPPPPPTLVTPVHPELVPQSLLPGKVMPSPQEIADRRLRATMGPARVAAPEESTTDGVNCPGPEATTQPAPAPKTSFMPLPPGSPPGPPPGAGGPADPNYKPTPDPIPISTPKSPATTPISQSKATVTPEQKK